jgi:hypothetical protein
MLPFKWEGALAPGYHISLSFAALLTTEAARREEAAVVLATCALIMPLTLLEHPALVTTGLPVMTMISLSLSLSLYIYIYLSLSLVLSLSAGACL